MPATTPDDIARAFHEAYERLAPSHGYKTREASAVPWEDVPSGNKGLMVATVGALLDEGVIVSAASVTEVYRERARLVAFLATHYPSVLAYADQSEPDWAVVYIHTPAGQMSWHIAPNDVELFDHVQKVTPDDELAQWDQHTTEEKYERLARMTRFSAIATWPIRHFLAGGA
jgi:hypothetical protein